MRWIAAQNILLPGLVGILLFVRVLTDDRSASNSRYSGSLNLSGAIAGAFLVIAFCLLVRRRRGLLPTALALLWLGVWTLVAVSTRGASTETLREGVREASVIALGVIVCNSREALSATAATRLVQLAALAPALIALYQVATHTGLDVAHHIRSNGTLAHPNSAAMFFAIATTVSLWSYLDNGRHRSDAFLVALFASAVVSTFSIDGLITLVIMLAVLGALGPASPRKRLEPFAIAGLVVLVFVAAPLGSQRISSESSTRISTAEGQEPDSTLAWRLHRWKTLLPEWERHPVLGRGLGTTTNVEGVSHDEFTGALPHNEYLRYLVETGVVGLVTLMWGLVLLVRRVLRLRSIRHRGTRTASTLAIAVVVGCLVNAVADNTFLNSPTCYVATLTIVGVLSMSGTDQRPNRIPRAT